MEKVRYMDREEIPLFVTDPSHTLKFSATIRKIGINPCVSVPEEISGALGGPGNIPVKGTINGFTFRSTLAPGRDLYRLYINAVIRDGAGVGAGDMVEILLDSDPDPRLEPIPDLLCEEFNRNPGAMSAWDALIPSRRKEILRYLNSLKSRDALLRNVEGVIGTLSGK